MKHITLIHHIINITYNIQVNYVFLHNSTVFVCLEATNNVRNPLPPGDIENRKSNAPEPIDKIKRREPTSKCFPDFRVGEKATAAAASNRHQTLTIKMQHCRTIVMQRINKALKTSRQDKEGRGLSAIRLL